VTDDRVVVIGAGQAGLAVSHELTARGVEHVVLERGRIGASWRGLWDSFCLVTPNWTVRLPGGHYDGADPDGFMPRDDIVAFFERYALSFAAPVREGVEVRSLSAHENGFVLDTSDGPVRASTVVVATGSYRRPHRPAGVADLASRVYMIDASQYRNLGDLPEGAGLVIGGGQSGCQIADELRGAGRDVFLSAGRVPWVPRRVGDRDIVHWHEDSGFFDHKRSDLPSPAARLGGNQQLSGAGGGRELNYRTLRAKGVLLFGHFMGVRGGDAHFADDLAASVAFGDARYEELRQRVRETCAKRGWAVPEMPDPEPFDATETPQSLPVDTFTWVVQASGYRPDYSWLTIPGACDAFGFPAEVDGASTVAPGLYFCGVHFMRTRKSSILIGVGEDAAIVGGTIAAVGSSSTSASR
jgi:putative flavoprotein involved in K+ transport